MPPTLEGNFWKASESSTQLDALAEQRQLLIPPKIEEVAA